MADSGGYGADVGKGSSGVGQEPAHQVNFVKEPRHSGPLIPAEESFYAKGLPKSGWTKTVFFQIPLCSLGQQQLWVLSVAHLLPEFPVVSLGSLLVSAASRAVRAGVHLVPGLPAHCGPAWLQGGEGSSA